LTKVLPLPTKKSEIPKDGQFLLVKPESGSKWSYAQTVSIKDRNVEIKLADGKTRTVLTRGCKNFCVNHPYQKILILAKCLINQRLGG
jgi:hypothetical protein